MKCRSKLDTAKDYPSGNVGPSRANYGAPQLAEQRMKRPDWDPWAHGPLARRGTGWAFIRKRLRPVSYLLTRF